MASINSAHSTEKLELLTDTLKDIVSRNPTFLNNVKSFKLEWRNVNNSRDTSGVCPFIEIEFHKVESND